MHPEVWTQQPVSRGDVHFVRGAEHQQSPVDEEHEPAARSHQPRCLGDPEIRVAPDARAVLGDDEVEAVIGKRRLLRVAMQERKLESELPLQASGRIQLGLGVVDPDRPSAAPCQPGRHIRGATAKLDHILPGDVVGEHPHLRQGHAPHPPRWLLTGPVAPARILVLRRPLVPLHAVPPDVIGKLAHLQHSLIGDRACADFAENRADEQQSGSRGRLM